MTKTIERRVRTAGKKTPGLKLRKRRTKRDGGGDGDQGGKPDDAKDAPGTVEGYAAVFYSEGDPGTEYVLWDDRHGRAIERIAPGAFTRAIDEGDDVAGLVNHDANRVIGRTGAGTLRLEEDGQGLRFEDDLPDTTDGRDLAESIARGDVSGCSFSFVVEQQSWRDSEMPDGRVEMVRVVESVRLIDVGPVTFPAYDGTSVASRAAGSAEEARAAYAAWRESRGPTAEQRARTLRVVEAELAAAR